MIFSENQCPLFRIMLYAPLMDCDNGEAGAGGQRRRRLFPRDLSRDLSRFLWGLRDRINPGPNQLFKKDLIFLSNSSNDVSPLIFSPLTKKVGVESTFSTSPAYFWSAVIFSSSV
jgi:hypothetical protein